MADKNEATSTVASDAKRQKLDDKPQKTTLAEFEAVFPKLEADLAEHAQQYKLPQPELEWFKKVIIPAAPRSIGLPGHMEKDSGRLIQPVYM